MTNDIDRTSYRDNRVRWRAYALWEAAGRPHGQHRAHWYQACNEVDDEIEEANAIVAADGPEAALLRVARAGAAAVAALQGRARPVLPSRAQRNTIALQP